MRKSAVVSRVVDCSDAELVERSRRSDHEAFAELRRRHSDAARAAALAVAPSADPDALVTEAFALAYSALRDGQQLTGAFRLYLYSMVRDIEGHVARSPEDSGHAVTMRRLSAYARGTLGARATSRVDAHLHTCVACAAAAVWSASERSPSSPRESS